MKKLFLSTLLLALPLLASAYDIAVENVDGVKIYYNYINNGSELQVTYIGPYSYSVQSYSGVVNIPDIVTYEGYPLPVTSIGDNAFYDCRDLTLVTIPNSVTYIGVGAFYSCRGLTSVTIPNSVTTIEGFVFEDCRGLTSVNIGNSVTNIGEYAFMGCTSLTSVVIPNGVTTIADYAFYYCEGLTSVTIPNSVTSIANNAFNGCTSLSSLKVANENTKYDSRNDCNAIIETATNTLVQGCKATVIPDDVTSIGNNAFRECRGLSSVTIPNSVTTIGNSAFQECTSLTSVTIPNSVSYIGDAAFARCSDLTSVTSEMENPCSIDKYCFEEDVFNSITLYVPEGTIEKYKSTDYWNKFLNMEEIVSTVTSVKAATESVPVLISSHDGMLTVKSELEGQSVAVYSLDGKALGSAKVKGGQAVIATNLPKGTIVVVKVGERSVKASL